MKSPNWTSIAVAFSLPLVVIPSAVFDDTGAEPVCVSACAATYGNSPTGGSVGVAASSASGNSNGECDCLQDHCSKVKDCDILVFFQVVVFDPFPGDGPTTVVFPPDANGYSVHIDNDPSTGYPNSHSTGIYVDACGAIAVKTLTVKNPDGSTGSFGISLGCGNCALGDWNCP
ncbi:MAG: hypothetical protein AB7O97_06375 [Planctomycetota bacterium]